MLLGEERETMMDVYMVAALVAIFGLFYAFASWCERVVDDRGGQGQ
ncbi:hypothetical protein GCM10010912_44910 [Paenibacillus albidus]|uniref:Uncharacterized protein n=1 Tax=Paenibacillus albidus TaxID=2041023 RepID=A0A917CQK3_9BACL|nr:hypothetical protein GCM10010912_44910 [Paenibacillus albidus]